MVRKICLYCGKEYTTIHKLSKYCSRDCSNLDRKGKHFSPETQFKKGDNKGNKFCIGKEPWNKGLSVRLNPKNEFKPFENSNETHRLWKGDKAGIKAKHSWVKRRKCKINCIVCHISHKEKQLEWVNIDHSYKRVLEDYEPMCRSCHRIYDIRINDYPITNNLKRKLKIAYEEKETK